MIYTYSVYRGEGKEKQYIVNEIKKPVWRLRLSIPMTFSFCLCPVMFSWTDLREKGRKDDRMYKLRM